MPLISPLMRYPKRQIYSDVYIIYHMRIHHCVHTFGSGKTSNQWSNCLKKSRRELSSRTAGGQERERERERERDDDGPMVQDGGISRNHRKWMCGVSIPVVRQNS